jgi:[glutamine synthetase] adenylyltransferase / [glutamine synthetase]-adenylyl-L-tyrosine phosphorylase
MDNLPPQLQLVYQQAWADFIAQVPEQQLQTIPPPVMDSIPKVWACSSFIAKTCILSPQLLFELLNNDYITKPYDGFSLELSPSADEEQVMQQLRLFRRREMIKIAWRDIAKWASLDESLRALSDLADVLIQSSLDYQMQKWQQSWGFPLSNQGLSQQLVVLGMGKLGGRELNFSSDIDLIFAYPEAGETQHPRRNRTNQEFFTKIGQQVIHLLNTITADGFVFRVDMRLRPFGDSGPLVMHFDAMEDYYQAHAREWERYAFIKARVVAGDKIQGQILLDRLKPFVYRRYLDYNSISEFRNMKEMIDKEAQRKGLEHNIKLGPGGIREVEFLCQLFQLMRGGRQPGLQLCNLLQTLNKLTEYGLIPAQQSQALAEAYSFLRLAENRLQAIHDQQTQNLPTDSLDQQRLAYAMGYEHYEQFLAVLKVQQQQVAQQFADVFTPEVKELTTSNKNWQNLWLQLDEEQAINYLQTAGFANSQSMVKKLQEFAHSPILQKLSSRGRQRVDIILPLILEQLANLEYISDAELILSRILEFLAAIAQRSVYLALLIERPIVLQHVIKLCANSQWIATQLTRYPLLLDELLDPRRLYDPLKPQQLSTALDETMAQLSVEDLEMQMDSLRQFKRAHVLHIAAAELTDNLTVEKASDYLGAVADTLVNKTLAVAWDFVSRKHGKPQFIPNQQSTPIDAGFCIVGYGKAGGIELSYSSDLDIVFIHDSCDAQQITDGAKPIDNNVFFMRLAQRIIHILTTNTAAGSLYEVDARLRPGGNSGMMVSSFEAFEQYQRQQAWTWEHQALVRARAIAGHANVCARFEQVRREILSLHREPQQLRQDVHTMREKMRQNLDKSNAVWFDIKQGAGGVVDIEFIIQYEVLRWAVDFPDLLDTTGMLPMLKKLAQFAILSPEAVDDLSQAYRTYRATTHKLALQDKPIQVEQNQWLQLRQQVSHWYSQIIN